MGIDDVFAVIAEGTRRQILENLRDGDRAVGELVVELQVSQPTVSKHLKVLREAGLVSMRAQGQKRYYSLNTAPLLVVSDWLDGFQGPGGRTTVPEPAPVATPAVDALELADVVPDTAARVESGPEDADALTAVVVAPDPVSGMEAQRPQIGRTMGRAAERAADLLSQLRRRRDPSS